MADFKAVHPFEVWPDGRRFSSLECAARSVVHMRNEQVEGRVERDGRFWHYDECRDLVARIPYNHRMRYEH